ncbi:MAG: TonB-dependent receptor [Gammaproteobacteria bacterium]|nr:TonB-dependent receptor [Gammaproteobacteria bacterium]
MLNPLVIIMATMAPSADPAIADEIDEVLVTATRREVSYEQVSAGLTVIDGDDMVEQKLVTDALASSVGVFLQQTTPGQGAAIIRGLKGSSILHLVNGMRLNNAIFRSAPTQYLALVPVTAIERIEVLRGTPTSLYGNDAVGGALQLVTRMPDFDAEQLETRGEIVAFFDTAELQKSLRATVDAGNIDFAASLSAELLSTGDRRTGSGERLGPSGFESRAARLLLSATPGAEHSWFFDLHYAEQPETPRVDELIAGFGQSAPSSSEFLFAPNRRVFAHAGYSRAGGPGGLDWKADAAWQQVDDDRVSRDFNAASRQREFNRSDLYGITLNGTRAIDSGSWIVGAEFYSDRVASRRLQEDLLTGQTEAVTARFPDGSRIRQAAVYTNWQRQVTARSNLSAGVRLTNDDITLAQTPVSASASIGGTDVSGDLGWIFDAGEYWQLVANIGLGFRSPNIFDLGTLGNRPGNRFNISNAALDSERVRQVDAGLRYRSDRLTFDLMLFVLQYDDRITSIDTGATTPEGRDIVQSVNAAESSIRGVEAGFELVVNNNVDLRALLNYTWGEQRVSGSAAEPADRIPPLNGKVTVNYDTGGALSAQGWLRFAGRQHRLSARDARDVRIDPNGTAGWATLGARIDWQVSQAWQLSFGIENVLDKQYRLHGSGLDAPGRNFAITARRNW